MVLDPKQLDTGFMSG